MEKIKNIYFNNCNCSDIILSVLLALLVAFLFKKLLDGKCVVIKVDNINKKEKILEDNDKCFLLEKEDIKCKI